MSARDLYDKVSLRTSILTTEAYSTSFSIGIGCLGKELRAPIYSIYGFVRFADEIVDTHHDHDQRVLLNRFKQDTFDAIANRISLNPVLHSFQTVVNRYGIDHELIHSFLHSMEMDLGKKVHDQESLDQYILGSAESVGLMCLWVFVKGDRDLYGKLKPSAMKLGSAFQKVNFLRDLNADISTLGRWYFPELAKESLTIDSKKKIEKVIALEFAEALTGIRQLPRSSRFGVYVAYLYYQALFRRIKNTPPETVLRERISVPSSKKLSLLCYSFLKHQFNLI